MLKRINIGGQDSIQIEQFARGWDIILAGMRRFNQYRLYANTGSISVRSRAMFLWSGAHLCFFFFYALVIRYHGRQGMVAWALSGGDVNYVSWKLY